MQATITTLNRVNFHEVVTLMWRVMNEGIGEGLYKRAQAEEYIKNNNNNIAVLEINDEVMGMYSFSDNPNIYTLNFFALNPIVRSSRSGYKLFLDMKKRLNRKPVIIPLYTHNKIIKDIVSKRGIFIGRFKAEGNKLIFY